MIGAALVMLVLAVVGFGYRMLAGPTLADRMIGLNGVLLAGVSAVVVDAVDSGRGPFLPAVVVVSRVRQSRRLAERTDVWLAGLRHLLDLSSPERRWELLDDGNVMPWRDRSTRSLD